MDIIAAWTVWAWIGWAATTAVLVALYGVTGFLGMRVFKRLTRNYSWRVLEYWLDRLEREGKRTFERPD